MRRSSARLSGRDPARTALATGVAALLAGCAVVATDQGTLGSASDGLAVEAGATSGSVSAGAPGPSERSLRFGLAVKGSDPATIAAIEEMAGADLGIVRVFARWDTVFPSADHQALLDAGRPIHLSVRPRTDAGRVIPWAEIARAEPGTATYGELSEWLEIVASYGGQIYFTLNHEPETRDSAANGTAIEYVSAWRKMAAMLRSVGGEEVPTVLVLGRGAYVDGTIDQWYPGDDVVDIVGVDPYNWYRCQGTEREWVDPLDLLRPALDFAEAHGKPLAVPEIASTEDPEDPLRKAEWIRRLSDVLVDPSIAERIEFVSWFSVHDNAWPDCDWAYDSTPQAAAAIADLLRWYSPDD